MNLSSLMPTVACLCEENWTWTHPTLIDLCLYHAYHPHHDRFLRRETAAERRETVDDVQVSVTWIAPEKQENNAQDDVREVKGSAAHENEEDLMGKESEKANDHGEGEIMMDGNQREMGSVGRHGEAVSANQTDCDEGVKESPSDDDAKVETENGTMDDDEQVEEKANEMRNDDDAWLRYHVDILDVAGYANDGHGSL